MKRILYLIFVTFSFSLYADNNITFPDLNTTLDMTKKISHDWRREATKSYFRMLNSIDTYFSESDEINKTSYREIRKSRMLVIFSLNDSKSVNIHLRGKVVLPQLKNRAEITFSQDDRQELDNQNAVSAGDDVVNDTKLRVGLKYYLYREKRSDAYAKLSLKTSTPFGPYLKFGIDKSYVSDTFLETKWNHALYYYLNGNKLSASTAVSFFKYITNSYWLGQGNKLYWKGEEDLYLTNSLLFYHIFDLNNRMVYKTEFTTSYNRLDRFAHDSVNFSIGFFHRFDKYFFIEAIPKWRKERENRYRSETLITLNFGVLLGK